MGWRTVIINNTCKLSYKNNYLVIRNDNLQMIHLSEINVIVVDTGQVSITSYLISELAKNKIKLIICDEKHNPICENIPYYGAFNTSKKILQQIKWDSIRKDEVWQKIVKHKIHNQAELLKSKNIEGYEKLYQFKDKVEIGDITNREGHAAKVYFNLLFGKDFMRGATDEINAALDYGYTILLSMFNREIVSKGYITQLGINHKNEYNFFNFSCDLMEPFRPLVDEIVFENQNRILDKNYKYDLINIMNKQIKINNKTHFVSNAISVFVNNVIEVIEGERDLSLLNYEL